MFFKFLVIEINPFYTFLNKVCFHKAHCEFPNIPRCAVVTHLFTVLFQSSRKYTIVCKETHKVCKNYTPFLFIKNTPLESLQHNLNY